jgi:hypothetical protein
MGRMRVGCCAHDALPVVFLDRITTIFIFINVHTNTNTGRAWDMDGSFLFGGVERSWGIADVETHAGVVVGAAGVPGSKGEADGLNGLHVWWTTGTVPVPGLPLSLSARIGPRGDC